MSLTTSMMDRFLPPDDQVVTELMRAKASGIKPVTHIGSAVQNVVSRREEGKYHIIKKYPKTMAWLADPENIKWLQEDLPNIIAHLLEWSTFLNKPVQP